MSSIKIQALNVCLLIFVSVSLILAEEESCEKDSESCDNFMQVIDGVILYPSLTGLDQDDPILIEALKNRVLIPPSNKAINLTYSVSMKNLNGQFSQPKTVEELLRKRWTKKKWKKKIGSGFFIEAGASEGEHISNTLYFELNHKWTGLLVEPNPDFIKDLKLKNRKAWILPHCLSTQTQVEIVSFDASLYNGGIIKEGKTLPADIGRTAPREKPLPHRRTLKVQCFPLYSVLMALDNPTVDYMSLDIEGAELPVLKTVPWSKVNFELIGIEIVHAGQVFDGTRDDIVEFLQENKFKVEGKAGHDEFFARETKD